MLGPTATTSWRACSGRPDRARAGRPHPGADGAPLPARGRARPRALRGARRARAACGSTTARPSGSPASTATRCWARPSSTLLPEALREEHGLLVERAARGMRPGAGPPGERGAHPGRQGPRRALAARLRPHRRPTTRSSSSPSGRTPRTRTPSPPACARARSSRRWARSPPGWPTRSGTRSNGAQLHLTFLERGLKRAGVDDADTLEAVQVVGDGDPARLGELVSEFLDFARPQPLDKQAPVAPRPVRARSSSSWPRRRTPASAGAA